MVESPSVRSSGTDHDADANDTNGETNEHDALVPSRDKHVEGTYNPKEGESNVLDGRKVVLVRLAPIVQSVRGVREVKDTHHSGVLTT
jgi:hypothetical protein